MHDLRLKVLRESGKTVSKKARSRPESARASMRNSPNISPSHSQINSPAHSRAGSRYASEEEGSDAELEDNMTMSTLSNGSDSGAEDASESSWTTNLHDHIVDLQDRKRTNTKIREATLMSYLHIIKHHYAARQVSPHLNAVVSALVRSVRSGNSSVERLFAIKSLQATLLTCPSEDLFEDLHSQLEQVCENDEDNNIKTAAIWAMAVAALYGGASESSATELLDYLVTIVESDGVSIGAEDSADVVTAALESWAFVASQIDDIADSIHTALEAFVEQLDSTDVNVHTSAGFNVAFIFEMAREYEEETGETMNLQYDPKRLINRMREASKASVKQTSRKDRRHMNKQFASIATSLELGKGPGYSTALQAGVPGDTRKIPVQKGDGEDAMLGYREKLRIGPRVVLIDSWSLMARIDAVRTLLGGGMPQHFADNPTIKELLDA
ncbi:Uncharacterized protein CTRI78_v006703 [Colletotrichum trifolii]|uniref:Interferon-related developmental regulator N-terminal domain-containing protein n=1 Tax=Colletotrichum trifolii TaxID=5466 RepID=A0A4R8RF24_COLTR|nr:Uncharacterized protein CTRI78_v006703 [Colletotrichum trifolii]